MRLRDPGEPDEIHVAKISDGNAPEDAYRCAVLLAEMCGLTVPE